MKIPRVFPIQLAAMVLLMGVGSLAAPCLAQDATPATPFRSLIQKKSSDLTV